MKKNQKILSALFAMTMLLLTACSGGAPADSGSTAPESPAPVTTESSKPEDSAAPAKGDTADAEFNGKLQGPFLMTTCGQSTGSVMCHMAAVQAGLTSTDEHNLLAEDVDEKGEGCNTLIITTGTSGKGMGAAGTDIDFEIERCTAVAEKAKENGMTVVCAHIEGMSRRTDANDQASIDAILPLADVIVCVEDSDSDGLFSNYATEHDIPIIIVPDALSLSEYME